MILEPRRLLAMDFGDAPDTASGTGHGNYQTKVSNNDNGPTHVIGGARLSILSPHQEVRSIRIRKDS